MATEPAKLTKAEEDSVFAMLASMDRATMSEQVDRLVDDAEALSPSTLSEPGIPLNLLEGAL